MPELLVLKFKLKHLLFPACTSPQNNIIPRATGLTNQPGLLEVRVDWYVVDPGLEGRIEKLEPLVTDVEHERLAHEQVLEAEAGSHAAEVEQIPEVRI